MRKTALIRVFGVVLLGLLLVSTWPHLLGLQRFPLVAQLTALRGLMVTGSIIAIVVLGIVALQFSRWRRYCSVMIVALFAVAAVNSAIMASRGFSTHQVHADKSADVTVFIWNMYRDGPEPQVVADFAISNNVDVVSLLESSPAAGQEISRLMGQAGRTMQVFVNTHDLISKSRSTVLLVSSTLGEYVVDDTVGSTPRVPAVVARPANHPGPTLISAHAAPPLPFMMRAWSGGLSWLAERCSEPNVIVAGDFNATLEHFHGLDEQNVDLGACHDGAVALGNASVGTWPSGLPPFLASPIDHEMATAEWEFTEFRVVLELDGLGSDHRALLAGLRRIR